MSVSMIFWADMIKAKISRLEWVFLVLIILFALILRITRLTLIPVFADEAIYIRWSQVMKAESSLRFLPLSDGKQPLFMWITIPVLKLISDPLAAGRLVSVLAGLATIIGVTTLTYLLTQNSRISLIAGLLTALSPFAFFFDRLALVDSFLSAMGLWIFIFTVITAKTFRLDTAMIAGFFLGFALLTKSPALIFALLVPLPFFIFISSRLTIKLIFKIVCLLAASYLIGFSMYNILRLGPEFHMVASRNQDYVFPFSEIITHPLNPLVGNLRTSASYLWYFLTPAVSLMAPLSLFKRKSAHALFFLWSLFLLPILILSLIAKVFTARYLVFVIPYVLILSTIGIDMSINFFQNHLKRLSTSYYLLLLAFLLWPGGIIIKLLTNPQSLALPRSEKSGYFELWTAGYGIKEAADYLKTKSQKPVVVGTEGYFGTLPNGLQIYLNSYPNIRIIGVGLFLDKVPNSLTSALSENEVYLLINDSRLSITNPDNHGLKLLASYPKATQPDGKIEHLLFFKLKSPK